jgi:hypothetical protein
MLPVFGALVASASIFLISPGSTVFFEKERTVLRDEKYLSIFIVPALCFVCWQRYKHKTTGQY